MGDLHGELSMLEAALDELQFDVRSDRLISVGDLIDRGPRSAASLRMLGKPWFYAVRGNHEALMLEAFRGNDLAFDLWLRNGGSWLRDCPTAELLDVVDLASDMPLALELERSDGALIGILHAELPRGREWKSAFRATQTYQDVCHPSEKRLAGAMLWGRRRFQQWRIGEIAGDGLALEHDPGVPGIDLVVCGHNVVRSPREPVLFGNVLHIDTGAYENDGVLTLFDIETGGFLQVCKREGATSFECRWLLHLAFPARVT